MESRLILVTGATGYVGGHLASALSSKGERLRLMSRRAHPENPAFVQADAANADDLPRVLDGVDTVYYNVHALGPNRDFEVVDLGKEGDPSLPTPNFLSTHYFMSRVVYPSLTSREIIYNTHFVKFFRHMAPQGNYCPIQFYLLKKR